jgi:hypothetical protein
MGIVEVDSEHGQTSSSRRHLRLHGFDRWYRIMRRFACPLPTVKISAKAFMYGAKVKPSESQRSVAQSAIGIDTRDDFGKLLDGLIVVDLACARRIVSTSSVFEHQCADVGLGRTVENGFPGREYRILFL